jgi:hypothetical protein
MPFYRMNGLLVHLKLGGPKSKHPKPCAALIPDPRAEGRGPKPRVRCLAVSTFLCDWKLDDGSTCDAPLCPDHATEVRPNVHLCPIHLAQQRERQPGLFE